MSPRLISIEARNLRVLFRDVRGRIEEKNIGMDTETLIVVKEAIFHNIVKINNLLRHPSIRGHVDPSILEPEVHVGSSFKHLLRRLERQVKAACILADVAHLGPAANPTEAEALSRISEILEQLYDTISPASSRSGSDTATESD
ncbi:unnamed protein product [Auanema sp. JU1783]|nr:unnamed protein product [Auanema sp. JU1783]